MASFFSYSTFSDIFAANYANHANRIRAIGVIRG